MSDNFEPWYPEEAKKQETTLPIYLTPHQRKLLNEKDGGLVRKYILKGKPNDLTSTFISARAHWEATRNGKATDQP